MILTIEVEMITPSAPPVWTPKPWEVIEEIEVLLRQRYPGFQVIGHETT